MTTEPSIEAARAATPAAPPDRRWLDAYGRMLLIRHFENEMQRLFLKGEVHGTTHLAAGQEAVPVGVCLALEPGDYAAGTYRGHGHALAKGTDPAALAAEMLGRAGGVCGGRAGSMNIVDLEHGLVGCYGIVGGSIGAATGAALSAKRQGRVAVAFFGDGAANQAYFHECLNFAVVHALPAVFVCENNFYGEFTPMQNVTGGRDIAARAAAYGMESALVDGNDLWAVEEAAREAVGRARGEHAADAARVPDLPPLRALEVGSGDVPAEGGGRALAGARPAEAHARAAARAGRPGGATVEAVERSAREAMDRAVEAALASPYPEPGGATEFAA